jgi:hypothetical protein
MFSWCAFSFSFSQNAWPAKEKKPVCTGFLFLGFIACILKSAYTFSLRIFQIDIN